MSVNAVLSEHSDTRWFVFSTASFTLHKKLQQLKHLPCSPFHKKFVISPLDHISNPSASETKPKQQTLKGDLESPSESVSQFNFRNAELLAVSQNLRVLPPFKMSLLPFSAWPIDTYLSRLCPGVASSRGPSLAFPGWMKCLSHVFPQTPLSYHLPLGRPTGRKLLCGEAAQANDVQWLLD